MKKLITRRKLLKGMGAVGASAFAVDQIIYHVIRGAFNRAVAATSGSSSYTGYYYVGCYFPGGPPRWMYDLALYNVDDPPNSDGIVPGLKYNPMIATGWEANNTTSTGSGGSMKSEYRLEEVNGVYVPPVWTSEIKDYSDYNLAKHIDNCMFIRGVETAPIHPENYKHFSPDSSVPSTHAMTSLLDTSLGIPCVTLGMSTIPFHHPNGMVPIVGSGEGGDALSSVLVPFQHEGVSGLKDNSSVDAKIKGALEYLETLGKNYNVNSAILHEERKKAKELLESDLSSLESEFTGYYAEYQSIISNALSADSAISGVDDQAIYQCEDPDTNYNDSSVNSSPSTTGYPNNWYNDIIGINDLRGNYSSYSNDDMATSFALAEVLLKNDLTNSLLLNMGQLTSGNAPIQNDSHDLGAIGTTLYFSKYFQTFGGCISRFMGAASGSVGLKGFNRADGKSLFDKTVIHVTSEFSRSALMSGGGSDHGGDASVATIFSGMIQSPIVLGKLKIGERDQGETYGGDWGESDSAYDVKDVHNIISAMFDREADFTGDALVTKSGDTVTSASSSGRSGLKIIKDLSKILNKL